MQRLTMVARVLLDAAILGLLLLQTYGLYIAAALTPRRSWRRRLDYRVTRTVFTMERLRLRHPE